MGKAGKGAGLRNWNEVAKELWRLALLHLEKRRPEVGMNRINRACVNSKVGKLLPDALYVHESARCALEPVLLEHVARAIRRLGPADWNVVKIGRSGNRVSFLWYHKFEQVPHPELRKSVSFSAPDWKLKWRSYGFCANPPILHRKDSLLDEGHPLRAKFARLTRQEERQGLLGGRGIGTRAGWEALLKEKGFALKGHRLVGRKS